MDDTVTLRAENQDDSKFLFELFESTKTDELALTGWSDADKERFLKSQLELQSRHYHSHFPETAFDIILERGKRVGRLYVERGTKAIIIHDISLIAPARGRGIGSYLLSKLVDEADAVNLPLQIYVEQQNPAMRLYIRLGFQPVKLEGIYYLMERLPG